MDTTDKTVQLLFDKLESRKQEVADLKAEVSKSWKTNGMFPAFGKPVPINIQTASEDTICECAVTLAILERGINDASVLLKRSIPYKNGGYSTKDWVHDFNKRLATIHIREAEAQLADIEARLNQVLSPEERRRAEIERISRALMEDGI